MELINHRQEAREAQRVQRCQEELVECLMQAIPNDGIVVPLLGLSLVRHSSPTPLGHGTSDSAFCVIAQGSKEMLLGEQRYRYDPAHYLITTAELPIATRITEASRERPYLGVVLKFDSALVGSLIVETGHRAPRRQAAMTTVDVSPLGAGLLDVVVRLVRLVDTPADMPVLAPLIIREIVYRLLTGEQGGRLRQMAALGGTTHRIGEAVARLRNDFKQQLRIEDLAHELGMSVSGFYEQFRTVTGMSPLQFQKQLRLQEARRLMLGGGLDAASAGFRVGYDDASYFNREYKKLFGEPPMRDVERLREGSSECVQERFGS